MIASLIYFILHKLFMNNRLIRIYIKMLFFILIINTFKMRIM